MDVKNGEQILKVQEADGGLVDVKFENILSMTDIQIQYPPLPTLADASALIGRTVSATFNGGTVTGMVTGSSLVQGAPYVTVSGEDGVVYQIPYENIRTVTPTQ